MFRAMYSAATGMNIAGRSNEITADNLAHVGVSGFRQRGVVFETFDRVLQDAGVDPPPPLIGGQIARGYTDFRPGAQEHTSAPLDIALGGDGFFTLQGPNGPVYSRDSVFQRAANGQVVNMGGLPLLGERGPITIPPQASNILVGPDGTVQVDGVAVDKLRLARFTNPDNLVPVGTALFQAPEEAGLTPSNALVLQGVREKANVDMPGAMVSLIRELRYFEAAQRALRSISEVTQLVTRG